MAYVLVLPLKRTKNVPGGKPERYSEASSLVIEPTYLGTKEKPFLQN